MTTTLTVPAEHADLLRSEAHLFLGSVAGELGGAIAGRNHCESLTSEKLEELRQREADYRRKLPEVDAVLRSLEEQADAVALTTEDPWAILKIVEGCVYTAGSKVMEPVELAGDRTPEIRSAMATLEFWLAAKESLVSNGGQS